MQFFHTRPTGALACPLDRHRTWSAGAVIALSLALASRAATAQDADARAAAPLDSAELAPVTVNARHGAERVRELPFSVHVVDGDQIQDARLTNVEDVLRGTPGVNVNSSGGPNNFNVSIRGVGGLAPMSMEDSSVGLNIDGATLPSRYLSLGTLDIDRIDVLKGPQGTLFGGIGEAGVVNITTRKPTRQTEGYMRAELGGQGQRLLEGAAGGALSPQLSARIAVRANQADLWVRNAQGGKPLTRPRELAWRGSVQWDLAPGTTALFTGERQEVERKTNLLVLRPYGDPPTNDLTPGLFDGNRQTVERYAFEFNHDAAASRITSITALTSGDFVGLVAYDRTLQRAMSGDPTEYWNVDTSHERVLSQDLRWGSLPDAPVFWVVGMNLSRAKRSYDTPRNAYGSSNPTFRDFTTDRDAIYGEVTYPLTGRLKLTGGLRQSWDHKTYSGRYVAEGAATFDRRALRDNYATGRVALSYALTPQVNLYGVLARGYKSGGFNDFAAQLADSAPYRPAVVNSLELGFKMESADRRASLNGALFANRVRDNHLMSSDPLTFVTSAVNANTRSRGAELEGAWRFDNGLSLSGGLSFIDASIVSDVLGLSGGDVRAGNRMPDVARWSGNLTALYRRPLPGFLGVASPVLNARVSYRVMGKRPADAQNHFNLASYQKLDLRVGLVSGSGELYLWADNLLNQRYDTYGYYAAPVAYGAPARGRTVGVGYTYQF